MALVEALFQDDAHAAILDVVEVQSAGTGGFQAGRRHNVRPGAPRPGRHAADPVPDRRTVLTISCMAVRTDGLGLLQAPLRIAHLVSDVFRRQMGIDGQALTGPAGAAVYGDEFMAGDTAARWFRWRVHPGVWPTRRQGAE